MGDQGYRNRRAACPPLSCFAGRRRVVAVASQSPFAPVFCRLLKQRVSKPKVVMVRPPGDFLQRLLELPRASAEPSGTIKNRYRPLRTIIWHFLYRASGSRGVAVEIQANPAESNLRLPCAPKSAYAPPGCVGRIAQLVERRTENSFLSPFNAFLSITSTLEKPLIFKGLPRI